MNPNTNKTNIPTPTDAVLAITYKCNSRCVMCDIWKIKDHNDTPAEIYRKLPKSLRTVNISGGEPFLNPEIVEIIKNVKLVAPKAKLIISSNGFLPDFIERKMIEILKIDPNIGVAISIDGVEEMQTEIRGIPNGYQKNLETIERLKKLGVKRLRVAFTATPANIQHASKVYELSRKLGVEFTCAVAQSSSFYFGGKQNEKITATKDLEKEFAYIIKKELHSFSPKRWARAYFAYGLKNFATLGNPMLPSEGAYMHFFMDPNGDIYPSVVHPKILGNLRAQNFDDIWSSENARVAREYVKSNQKKSWMICTSRTSIKKHPLRAFLWFLKQNLLVFLKVS